MIPSLIGYAATRVNFDVLSYIPQNLESVQGEDLLEEPFHMAARRPLLRRFSQISTDLETVPFSMPYKYPFRKDTVMLTASRIM